MAQFEEIHTETAPLPIGCYSQGLKSANLIFLSGQIGLNPTTQELVTGGVEAELLQIFSNLQALVQASGKDFSSIIKLTIFLTDLKNFALINEKMHAQFNKPYPARSVVEVSGLPKGAQIEIEAILINQNI